MDAPVLEFVAVGPEPGQRWRRRIHRGHWVRLGRAPANGWSVPWDMRVSREHADLILEGERLRVRCLDSARNSVYLLGVPTKDFTIADGENFRIGETTFYFEKVSPGEPPDAKVQPADSPESRRTVAMVDRPTVEPSTIARRKQEQRSLNDSRNSAVVALKAEVKALTAQMQAVITAQRKAAELESLQSDVESLKSQMQAKAAAHQEAVDDVRRTAEKVEIQREVEGSARREAEAAESRAQVENEALRKTEESAWLQIQHAEARLAAEKLAQLKTEEAGALKLEVEQLKARLDAQVAAQRKSEEEARRRADEAKTRREAEEAVRRKLEEAARLKTEEAQARRKAEEEARRRADEAEALKSEVDALKCQLEADLAAQRKAQQLAVQQAEQAEAARRKAEDEAKHLDGKIATIKAEEAEFLRKAEEEGKRKEAEASALRQEIEALKLAMDNEIARAQREISLEAKRRADETEARRKAEEQARQQTENEIRRKHEEAEALKVEVEALREKMESEAAARRQAEVDAQRQSEAFKQLEKQLTLATAAHHQAAEDARRMQEQADAQRRIEAEARREAEIAGARLKTEQAARKQAEEMALEKMHEAETRVKIEKLTRLKAEEADALRAEFDPYYHWLGIRPDEQPADYYRLLGLSRFENNLDVIEGAADRQMAHVRRHQTGKRGRLSQTLLNELSTAKLSLFDPEKKRQYDEMLKHTSAADRFEARPADIEPDETGILLGEYTLVDHVDRSGSGHVFKAEHQTMGRVVALKILSDEESSSPKQIARFQRKVRLLARLNHPNLVAAFDAGSRNGKHYLIMEYVDGIDLISLVKQKKTLAPQEAVGYVIQAAAGLSYAHAHQIVHRNVKPGHILVDCHATVKVIGLGLALFQGDASLNAMGDPAGNLEEARVIGSVDFIAPEQTVNSGLVDARADIYGLGCTLYTVLTRRPMFPVKSARRKLLAHRHEPAPTLRELRPDAPESLQHVYGKMVAKNPDDRFQSMDQVIEVLSKMRF